ncbi:MAG: hypothetical protein U0271_43320 [Polyangiaceae bacterium]
MDTRYRPLYNATYSDALHAEFLERLEKRLGCGIPYRVAETPFFIPDALRDRLASHAREVLDQVTAPALVDKMRSAIPAKYDTAGMDAQPNCVQIDFAITQNEDGSLDGRVVELQAFPSLYAMMTVKLEVVSQLLADRYPGLDRPWSVYYDGMDRASFTERFRRAVVADEDPEEVVLLDLHPETQKTLPDFAATKILIGIDAVCPTKLIKEGAKLYREKDGRRVPVRRIYNRIVFDELAKEGVTLPFSYNEDLDVTWCSHPNWYWVVSKYSLPFIDHPSVPRARTLRELGSDIPGDLENYVMKPLFSFAGAGVKVDVTREDIDAVPAEQRAEWLLQKKITYHPGIPMPSGEGVKAEVRMMFLRAPDEPKPRLSLNLVRLSRGKMLGVDQNRNLTWVGGSIGLFDGSGH